MVPSRSASSWKTAMNSVLISLRFRVGHVPDMVEEAAAGAGLPGAAADPVWCPDPARGRVMRDRLAHRLRSRQGDPMRFVRLAALAAVALAIFVVPVAGRAQQAAGKVYRIGVLSGASVPLPVDHPAFLKALRELG